MKLVSLSQDPCFHMDSSMLVFQGLHLKTVWRYWLWTKMGNLRPKLWMLCSKRYSTISDIFSDQVCDFHLLAWLSEKVFLNSLSILIMIQTHMEFKKTGWEDCRSRLISVLTLFCFTEVNSQDYAFFLFVSRFFFKYFVLLHKQLFARILKFIIIQPWLYRKLKYIETVSFLILYDQIFHVKWYQWHVLLPITSIKILQAISSYPPNYHFSVPSLITIVLSY